MNAGVLARAEEREESLWVASGLPVNANPVVLSASFLAFTGGGRLSDLVVYNSDTATTYVQLFDSQAIPADGLVPYMVWQLPTLSTLTLEWRRPKLFQRGCWIINSSTDTTKTLGAAKLLIDVSYV